MTAFQLRRIALEKVIIGTENGMRLRVEAATDTSGEDIPGGQRQCQSPDLAVSVVCSRKES